MEAKEFGEMLSNLRGKAKITQKALAEAIFVHPSLVNHWEKGRRYPPNPLDFEKVVEVLSDKGIPRDELDALREAGWHNYSLFMREDGLLFGYVETPDFEQALANMAETDVNKRWQDFMAPYFENSGGKHADESMIPLEQVFYLE